MTLGSNEGLKSRCKADLSKSITTISGSKKDVPDKVSHVLHCFAVSKSKQSHYRLSCGRDTHPGIAGFFLIEGSPTETESKYKLTTNTNTVYATPGWSAGCRNSHH